MVLAVCTKDYGERTENAFSTYYEMEEILRNNIDVLPLQVQDDWKPSPPCGKDHLDRNSSALGLIDDVFKPSLARVDCRKLGPSDIATAIAAKLHGLPQPRPSIS